MLGRKSQRLRLSEVHAVHRLVGECRDLGADPGGWREHVARSFGRLTGGAVCGSAEAVRSAADGTPGEVLQHVTFGWPSPAAREVWASYVGREEYRREPIFRTMQACANRRGLCARHQVIEDSTWLAASIRNETFRACELDEFLVSFYDLPGGRRQDFLSVYRPLGAAAFCRRERLLVRLFHAELGRHLGASLVTLDDPNPASLAPRLRNTLRCLLEGDSEKQAARRLGLSTLTVHEYVKSLYRHFRVSSRSELMAYFLRRSGYRLPEAE